MLESRLEGKYIQVLFAVIANKLSILLESCWVKGSSFGGCPRTQTLAEGQGARNTTPVASAIVRNRESDYRAICMRKIRHKSKRSQGIEGVEEVCDENGGAHGKGSEAGKGMWLEGEPFQKKI
jgi:hypothetical protein